MDVKIKMTKILFVLSLLLMALTPILLKSKAKPYDISNVLPPNHPVMVEYNKHLQKYPNDENLFILINSKSKFTSSQFLEVKKVESLFRQTPHLSSLSSIFNSEYFTIKNDHFKLEKFIDSKYAIPADAQRLLQNESVYSRTYLSPDQKSTMIYLQMRKNLSKNDRQTLINNIHHIRRDFNLTHDKLTMHALGADIARFHFFDEVQQGQKKIMPLLLAAIFILIYLCFGSKLISLLSLYIIGLSYSLTSLLIITIAGSLDPFNSFSLLLVLVIATSDLIHFFSKLGKSNDPMIAAKKVMIPCFLTTITTILGLIALSFSYVMPVKHFGIFASFGVACCFLLTLFWLPHILQTFHINIKINPIINTPKLGGLIFHFVKKYKRVILLVSLVPLFSVLFFYKNLKVEDNLYNKFVESHPLTQANSEFGKSFNFTGSIDLVVTSNNDINENFKSLEFERKMSSLKSKILKIGNIAEVKSAYSIFNYIRSFFNLPPESNFQQEKYGLNKYLNLLEDFSLLDGYLPPKYKETRLILFVKSISSTEVSKIRKEIFELSRLKEFSSLNLTPQGFVNIRSELMGNIFSSFYKSFFFGFISITLVFLFIFNSFKWTILAIIPNVVPLIIGFTTMLILDMTVEYNLIIICSIILGIGVDDTIHFLYAIRKNLNPKESVSLTLEKVLTKTGSALMNTTLILILTLPTFFLTNLLVFYQMALILCLSLTAALFADLFLLPAIILNFNLMTHSNHKLKKFYFLRRNKL